jgi:hypothetical protein
MAVRPCTSGQQIPLWLRQKQICELLTQQPIAARHQYLISICHGYFLETKIRHPIANTKPDFPHKLMI